MKKYNDSLGHFHDEGKEYVVLTPQTIRSFDNFLWNRSVFSNVQQTGVGCMDYQIGDTEGIQLLTGIGRVCDFDVFGRDGLMNRLIYIKDLDSGVFWNLGWEPVCREYEDYSCTHGLGYTLIRNRTEGIEGSFRIFIPAGEDPVELWTIVLKNESPQKRRLALFSYNQIQLRYKWDFDSYGDMIFRGSRFDRELNGVIVEKHPFRKPHDCLSGFLICDHFIESYDGNRESFVGTYRSLSAPQAVINGYCSNTPGSSDASTAAVQFTHELAPGEELTCHFILGAGQNSQEIGLLRDKYLNTVESEFLSLKKGMERNYQTHTVTTQDKYFDQMFNYWLKHGSAFGAQWCRWGWNGYRDIVQHGMGISPLDPARTGEILLEALTYQYSSGLALRGWNPVDEKSYSDSALWLVFTLCAYIKETGDKDILEKTRPFYDGGEASVLSHIKRALDFLENNKGVHNLCLIKFGDWNDSLTGVGKEGRGESVWLSMAYGEALKEIKDLSEFTGDSEAAKDFKQRFDSIKEAVNRSAWNGSWYARCFDDEGEPIGSGKEGPGRIFLNPQAWSMITGMASQEQQEKLIASCDIHLQTDQGYQLLADPYYERDKRIGRISCLEPGICENGTVYSHVNAWMILGLLRAGYHNKAYDLLKKNLPGYYDSVNPPYMIANCYYGPDHKNRPLQMEFTWITGSLAWFNHIMTNEFLGAKADYTGLLIEPKIPGIWERVDFKRRFRDVDYHISIHNPSKLESRHYEITIDGEPWDRSPIIGKKDSCHIEVTILKESPSEK